MNKKIALGILICGTVIAMTGCSKVEYTGSNFEDFFTEQIQISGLMKGKLESALTGVYYEDMSNSDADIREYFASLRAPGSRTVPQKVNLNEDIKSFKGVGSVADISNETYLDDTYQVTRYIGEGGKAGAYKYEITFTGEKDDVWDSYLRYIAKIENEFGSFYGDEKYRNTELTTINQIGQDNKYIALYHFDNYYVTSIGYYSSHNEEIVHRLYFMRAETTHDLDWDYAEAIYPFSKMVQDKNVPDDFDMEILFRNTAGNEVTSSQIISHDDKTDIGTEEKEEINIEPEQSPNEIKEENSEEQNKESDNTSNDEPLIILP